jgi:hypothetical protein
VLASDLNHGFLLVTDLGDLTLERAIYDQGYQPNTVNPAIDSLYKKALDLLVDLQVHTDDPSLATLPAFDSALQKTMLTHCQTWFIEKLLAIDVDQKIQTMLTTLFNHVITQLEQQPAVLLHADYQCRNLMVLPNNTMAMIDFQFHSHIAVHIGAQSLNGTVIVQHRSLI